MAAHRLDGTPKPISLTITDELAAQIDQIVGRNGRSRFIREAIVRELAWRRRETKRLARIEAAKPPPPIQFGHRTLPPTPSSTGSRLLTPM